MAYGGLTWQSSTVTATPGTFTTTGAFTLAANTAQIVNNTATSNTWTIGTDVTINSGTTLLLAQNSSSSTGNAALAIAGGLTNNGTLSKGVLSTGTALINFNGTGTSNVTWGNHSGTFNVTVGSGNSITFLDNLTDSSGLLTVNGTLAISSNKTATVGSATITGTLNGPGAVSAGTAFDLQSGSAGAILAGNASLTKSTGDAATLTGANTYSGGTTVSAGTLSLSGSGTLGNTSGTLTVNGGMLSLGSTNQQTGAVTLSAGSITGSTGTLNGTSYGLSGGTLSAKLSGTGVMTVSGSTTLSGDNSSWSGGTTVSSGTLTTGHNSALGTGAVTVNNGGTLSLGSGFTHTNTISVNSGGYLGGLGTVGGTATVSFGGYLSPGNSAGILNVGSGGTLNLSSGSIYQWELAALATTGAGTNFDQIFNRGTVNLTSGALINLVFGATLSPDQNNAFWNTNQSWTVIAKNGMGTITGTAVGLGISNDQSLWSGKGSFSTSIVSNELVLNWTAASAVPEPSTYAAIAGACALAGVAWQRRKQRTADAKV